MTIEQQLEDMKRQLAASEDRELGLRRNVAALRVECATLSGQLKQEAMIDQIAMLRRQWDAMNTVARDYQVRGMELRKCMDEIAGHLGFQGGAPKSEILVEYFKSYMAQSLERSTELKSKVTTLEAELAAARAQIAKLTCPSGN